MSRKYIFFWVILMLIIYENNVEALPPPEPSHIEQQPQQQQQQQQVLLQQHNVRSFRNALNQQGIQSLLQSIENRLSNLDQIYSQANRYSQRSVDLNTDQYVRKIEMLESKLTRLESLLDAKLEKLSENLSSKNFRDDITKDQIFRKIDSIYERFNHKITYVEEKFDVAFFKLQNRFDVGLTKIERLDDSINVRNADIESEISEGIQISKAIKTNVNSLEENVMNVTRVYSQNLAKIDAINTNIAKSLLIIENKIVNHQDDDESSNNFTKKEPSYNYSNKINNMYNELWKKSNTIESDIKNSIELMNLTRIELQDILKNTNNQNDDTLDIIVDSFKNMLQRKLADLGRKMEDNFKNIIATQNLFLESCKSIQMDETQLERKISIDLEKLLDSLSNRDLANFKEQQNTEEIIKKQNNNIERLINQNKNQIIKLSEKTSEDRKKIEKVLSIVKKDLASFIEEQIYLHSLESGEIEHAILAQVNDLDKKMNKDNMNYNAKQMLQVNDDDDDEDEDDNVLKQTTKDIFTKQVNISAIHNTINSVDVSVKDIHKLLYDIYIKINKCYDVNNTTQMNNEFNGQTKTDETVDIIFGEDDKNTHLFRYNYSVIDDNITNNLNIPVASTVPPQTQTLRNNNNYDDGLMVIYSSEESTLSNSEENKLLENVDYEDNKKLNNNTNNIISIDNKKDLINNSPPDDDVGDSDQITTSKTESNVSGVDIFEELYEKFFGQKNDASSEYLSTTKPEISTSTDYEEDDYSFI